jgi:uncharacterized membrane protein (DUF106 family)
MASLTPAEEIAELKDEIQEYKAERKAAIEARDNEEKKRLEGIIAINKQRLTFLEQQQTAQQGKNYFNS